MMEVFNWVGDHSVLVGLILLAACIEGVLRIVKMVKNK